MVTYTIHITRLWETENSTISRFSISGSTLQGYILERPGPDTVQEGLLLRIPEGDYDLSWRAIGKFATKYGKVPQLSNYQVSKKRLILIHPGNVAKDSQGCLLPGRIKEDNKVNDSVSIFKSIKKFIEEKGIENVKVKIKSCYDDSCPTTLDMD